MLTVGGLFDKLKVEIFPEINTNKFYQNCKFREKEIKKFIRICLTNIEHHIKELHQKEREVSSWKKIKIKSCVLNLSEYMEYLADELEKDKIEKYCITEKNLGAFFSPFMPDLVLIMINSYQGAVETDLYWITDLILKDAIDISSGNFDFKKMDKYLPNRIKEIQTLSKELQSVSYVKLHFDSINEAVTCYNTNLKKACNLLLMTIIEGLVRSLGAFLIEKQKLEIDPFNKKYTSLDVFLRKIPWKNDFKINEITCGLLTGSYALYKKKKSDEININLQERLGFLSRRFKENRNVILHGQETDYAKPIHNFLNFSALKEVLFTIKEYQAIYK
jgi:hypothetical protein